MSLLSWFFGEEPIKVEEPSSSGWTGNGTEPSYWWRDNPTVEEPSDQPWW